jgi:predicted small secreted protein
MGRYFLEDNVELNEAIELLKKVVKHTGNIDQKHIDLTLAPADEQDKYERALRVAKLAIKDGQISEEDFKRRVQLS